MGLRGCSAPRLPISDHGPAALRSDQAAQLFNYGLLALLGTASGVDVHAIQGPLLTRIHATFEWHHLELGLAHDHLPRRIQLPDAPGAFGDRGLADVDQ